MEITQQTSATGVTAPQPSTTSSTSVLSSDFEVFLQMLTAQAEYQDPLEPIDSSEYAAQLAQFSMVEQQVQTNDLMEQMLTALGTNDMSGAANWIGMDALVDGPVVYEGTPIDIAPNPPVLADDVALVVSNAQGTEVARLQMPTGAETFTWDGRTADGTALPHGEYTLQVESRAEGAILATDPALSYARVTEARIDNGQALLVLDSGYMIFANSVIGLRDAG